MGDYGGFPMSVIVTGFFVTSLAYLICFCCCIVQFFIRRNRALNQNHGQNIFGQNINAQKNDKMKGKLMRQFTDSLKRFKKSRKKLPSSFVLDEGLPLSCPICFEEYTGDVEDIFLGYIKTCKHFYHFDCIWKWLENSGNCPLCREKVKLTEEDIKGISLRNLPKYLKDNNITISKEDHYIMNTGSDTDSSIYLRPAEDPDEVRPETSTSLNDIEKGDGGPSAQGTQLEVTRVDVENVQVYASIGDQDSETNTLESKKSSSGSSAVSVRTEGHPSDAHSNHKYPGAKADKDSNQSHSRATENPSDLDNEPIIATRIEIRGPKSGVSNLAFNKTEDS